MNLTTQPASRPGMSDLDATILITTRNRKDELRKAVESCLMQTGARIETLVIDDASTDGTSAMLAQDYPQVRVHTAEVNRGLIVHRNLGAKMARGRIVFSIDDDAVFMDPLSVARTLNQFDHERIGAVSIPYRDVLKSGDEVATVAPDDRDFWLLSEYRGTAHALRRDVFLTLGGYFEPLIHQGEEVDYAYRLLEAGYVVRAGFGTPIHHFESPKRDRTRQWYFSAKNNIVLIWKNSPLAFALVQTPVSALKVLVKGVRDGYGKAVLRGTWAGIADCLRRVKRTPLTPPVFALFRRLRTAGTTRFHEVESLLPPRRAV